MTRKYTAKEMREAAEVVLEFVAGDEGFVVSLASMLRQAADDMEREEREKKWEYSVKSISGEVCGLHDDDKPRIPCLDNRFTRNCIIVRREVAGEWEEVE